MARPDAVADKLAQAMALLRQGHLAEARRLYRSVLSRQPTHVDALHFMGVLLHRMGQSEEAVLSIRRALAQAPRYLDAQLNLGNIHLELGQLDAAEGCFRRVLALAADEPRACNNLGVILRRLGRLAESAQVLQQALAIDGDRTDTWVNLGNTHRDAGALDEAQRCYRRAIELDPLQAQAYAALSKLLVDAGRNEQARTVLTDWLRADPGQPIARHHLAGLGGEVPARASDAYVQQTFDDFAATFDEVLKTLDYRAPERVMEAVAHRLGPPQRRLDVLDAGCGTGICGSLLRPYARRLTGVDLSQGMLDKARGRKTYDALEQAELVAWLEGRGTEFDLIVSADTFIYFGELHELLLAARKATRPGGLLVFTVERAPVVGDRGFVLHPHGRYAHDPAHVLGVLQACGWQPQGHEDFALRKEAGVPVVGVLMSATAV